MENVKPVESTLESHFIDNITVIERVECGHLWQSMRVKPCYVKEPQSGFDCGLQVTDVRNERE